MEHFTLFATPWWVNLLILIPLAAYIWFKKSGVRLNKRRLLIVAIFGTAFAFVEAAVVVYLRAALGFFPAPAAGYEQVRVLSSLTKVLLGIELSREAETIV